MKLPILALVVGLMATDCPGKDYENVKPSYTAHVHFGHGTRLKKLVCDNARELVIVANYGTPVIDTITVVASITKGGFFFKGAGLLAAQKGIDYVARPGLLFRALAIACDCGTFMVKDPDDTRHWRCAGCGKPGAATLHLTTIPPHERSGDTHVQSSASMPQNGPFQTFLCKSNCSARSHDWSLPITGHNSIRVSFRDAKFRMLETRLLHTRKGDTDLLYIKATCPRGHETREGITAHHPNWEPILCTKCMSKDAYFIEFL